MSKRLISIDDVDELALIRDQIDVIWLALQSEKHIDFGREALARVIGVQHERLSMIVGRINSMEGAYV